MKKQEIKSLLSTLVSINSIYPNEKKLSTYLVRLFRQKRYKVETQLVEKDRYNVIVEKGRGKKVVVLYAHLDTINLTGDWRTNPFKLTIRGDKAYGLGAWDMKAGMAANILAFLNYIPWTYRLRIVFCVDEENISKGGFKLIKSPFMKDVSLVLSTEPALHTTGLQGIVTGRPGRAVYNIKISGTPKHIAFYEKRYDTNYVASELIRLVENMNINIRGKKQFMFIRKMQSQTEGISTPAETHIEVDSYIIKPTTHTTQFEKLKKICEKLTKKYPHFQITVTRPPRATPSLEPYENTKKEPYTAILCETVKEVTGKKAIPYFRMSVADENVFGSAGITTFGIGPTGGDAHAPNEWVSLSSIQNLYTVLTKFLEKIDHDLG